jgi:hypothetical protein
VFNRFAAYRDKKVVEVSLRFRAPLPNKTVRPQRDGMITASTASKASWVGSLKLMYARII